MIKQDSGEMFHIIIQHSAKIITAIRDRLQSNNFLMVKMKLIILLSSNVTSNDHDEIK